MSSESRYLDVYADTDTPTPPELTIQDLDAEIAAYAGRALAIAESIATWVRRLGPEATSDELGWDKRQARRVAYAFRSAGHDATLADRSIDQVAAVIEMDEWIPQMVRDLILLRTGVANLAIAREELRWGNQNVHRLTNLIRSLERTAQAAESRIRPEAE